MKKKKNSSLTPVKSKPWRFLRWLNIALVLLSFLSLLAPFSDPQVFWPLALIGLLTPVFLVFHVLFFLFWIYQKKYYWLYSIGILLMSWSSIKGLIGFQPVIQSENTSLELKVLSYNTHMLRSVKNAKTISPDAFAAIVQGMDPDIICLQEFAPDPSKRSAYAKALASIGLKHHHHNPGKAGAMSIFSKYPLDGLVYHNFSNEVNGFQAVELKLGATTFRVYNTHLQSNYVTGLTNELADRPNLQEKETWQNIRQVAARYKRSAVKRSEQAKTIKAHINESKVPVIVCGDFNDIAPSYTYRILKGDLKDAFLERGRAWGATYAGKIPGLRIDYILSSTSFRVNNSRTYPAYFSDHHPLVAYLQVPEN